MKIGIRASPFCYDWNCRQAKQAKPHTPEPTMRNSKTCNYCSSIMWQGDDGVYYCSDPSCAQHWQTEPKKLSDDSVTSNPFLALANALWSRGEDGEIIARDLAVAFREIARQANNGNSVEQEFRRLTSSGVVLQNDRWEEEPCLPIYPAKST